MMRPMGELATLQLETPRLLLRPTRPEDFEAWAAFMADAESARFIGGVQTRPRVRLRTIS